jgi:hypothetical protein
MTPTSDQIEKLIAVVRSISHGDVHGPTGLEMLAMAIAGERPATFAGVVNDGFSAVAQAIENAGAEIARALREDQP